MKPGRSLYFRDEVPSWKTDGHVPGLSSRVYNDLAATIWGMHWLPHDTMWRLIKQKVAQAAGYGTRARRRFARAR